MLRKTVLSLSLVVLAAAARAAAPVIFYSDLTSGPNTGGQNNKGAFVTIFGVHFGDTQGAGAVSVGGGAADNYAVWSDSKVVFQLGSSAASGNITITTADGTSNGVPFTVRSCDIYFVSTGGSDTTGTGSYASPWRHLSKARSVMSGGDICYIRGGTYTTSGENSSSKLFYVSGSYPWGGAGSDGAPNCMVGYPGETAVLQATSDGESVINYVGSNSDIPMSSNIVFANLVLDANSRLSNFGWRGCGNGASTVNRVKNLRIVNVEVKNFKGPSSGGTAGLEFGGDGPIDNLRILGCSVHDIDTSSKLDHGIYFSAGGGGFEVGWSKIYNIKKVAASGGDGYSGFAIQTYHGSSSNYAPTTGVVIHDNMIYECPSRGGINLADYTIDSLVYNNIIYGCGYDGLYEGTGLRVITTDGGSTGTHKIYNNTFYNCGKVSASDNSSLIGLYNATYVYLRNNVIKALANQRYSYNSLGGGTYTTSNNIWHGNGAKPAWTAAGELNTDPMLMSPPDSMHLVTGSPCISAGYDTTTDVFMDYDGNGRIAGSVDMGALQYSTSTPVFTYYVSGYALTQSSAGVSGVDIALSSGGVVSHYTTGSSGYYIFSGRTAGSNATITPTLSGFTFSPAAISINNMTGSQTNRNFFRSNPASYSISGYVRDESGAAAAGVSIRAVSTWSNVYTATTDSSGYYSMAACTSGCGYTVTPSMNGFTFEPANISISSLGSDTVNPAFKRVYPPITEQSTVLPLQTGEAKVIGSKDGRGVINPDKGGTAKIYYKGSEAGEFTCKIFTLTGDLVWERSQDDAEGMFEWVPKNIASGTYVVFVNGPGVKVNKKVIIIR